LTRTWTDRDAVGPQGIYFARQCGESLDRGSGIGFAGAAAMTDSIRSARRKTEKYLAESGAKRRRGLIFGSLLVLVAGIVFFVWQSRSKAPSEDALLDTTLPKKAPVSRGSNAAPRPLPPGKSVTFSPNDTPQDIADKRLARARHTLEGYKIWARYPPGSRPLSEMPDLQKPHSVQPSTQPLATADGNATKKARVTLNQDRLYLVGDESAKLHISCTTSDSPARCEVLSAMATSVPSSDNVMAVGPVPVPFTDDGQGGAVASFGPAKEGFSSYHGGIDIKVDIRVGAEEGRANFHVIYTPSAPARFTGKIREAIEDGSLCLYVQMDVAKAGRYVLMGRVNDAQGEGFAYLEFNELMETGLRDAKMCVFGLLVLDQRAQSPFVLRDLEGFVLFEDRNPDRELMSVLEGNVYTTKKYEESAFSSAEWQSDEKTRHIDEFGKDVDKGIDEGGEP
jgi:hypothetical protein